MVSHKPEASAADLEMFVLAEAACAGIGGDIAQSLKVALKLCDFADGTLPSTSPSSTRSHLPAASGTL